MPGPFLFNPLPISYYIIAHLVETISYYVRDHLVELSMLRTWIFLQKGFLLAYIFFCVL